MQLLCLKPFKLSTNGVDFDQIKRGDTPDVPHDMIEGLILEGFLEDPAAPAKPLETKPQTNDLETKPDLENLETKDEVEQLETPEIESLRASYFEATGDHADLRWSAKTLRDKLIEA